MKIGFIGLGIMGKPMSKNLVKAGYELVVYNRSQAKADELVEMGAIRGTNPADVAGQCRVIITMLPNSPQVREVCLGENGIIEAAQPLVDATNEAGETITGIVNAIQDGLGSTLKSTGIIIGLGVMMGGILEESGAAEKMAYSFIRAVGKKKEEWALAMAAGLQLTHCLVPPTPGPTTAASMLDVDVGQMIIFGSLISILMLVVAVFYCQWIGKKIYQIPREDGGFDRKEFKKEYIKSMDELEHLMNEKQLPGLGVSIAPIVVPLILILANTILDLAGIEISLLAFLGSPIIALAIGTLLAIYGLMAKSDNKKVLNIMDNAIKSTGIIMLITGAGGSLGNVIKVSGVGNALGELVLKLPLPAVLIPFLIAALMRIALGSATVAITTAASLSAPLLGALSVSPLLMAISCCVGAISFSYFNDSGFWVWNGMFGVDDIQDQIRCKTAISMIMSVVGVVELLILSIFMH